MLKVNEVLSVIFVCLLFFVYICAEPWRDIRQITSQKRWFKYMWWFCYCGSNMAEQNSGSMIQHLHP